MLYDKMTMFASELEIPVSEGGTTTSKIVDFRNSRIDDGLKIFGTIVGDANTAGTITTNVQTSDDGTSWTTVGSMVQNGATLIAMCLPANCKRFVRLAFGVGATALNAAVKVTAGLVDAYEHTDAPAIQKYPPLEDLAPAGDTINS